MGVKSFFQEVRSKISPSRLFKAFITERHDVVPKLMPEYIKSIETVEGHGVTVGCIRKTSFAEGVHFKYMKHQINALDTENYTCKYTLIEGDVLGDKLEKICYEMKFESSDDGGCVIKMNSEYHTKEGVELNEEEIKWRI